MKKTGQITAIIFILLFTLLHLFPLDEVSITYLIIDLAISIIIAWVLGRQYDKMKFYLVRMNESEGNYRQLIDTLPNAILIYYKEEILYVNDAGKSLLGAKSKEEVLGRSVYQLCPFKFSGKSRRTIKSAS